MQRSGEKTPVQPDRLRRVEQLFNECRMQKRLPERKKVQKDSEEVPGSVSGAFSGIFSGIFSGAAMIATSDGPVFSCACGYENLAYGIENRLDTAFDTASITKLFTAAGIVLLESRGLLRLEDPVHSILDLGGTRIPEDVRLVHLLTHTSGIADDADEEGGEDYSALFVETPNYSFRENRDFLKNFVYKEPNFRAGEQIRYNNCGFILLGLVIEKLTGKEYRTFITEEIFRPFGMKDSFFAAKEDTDKRFAEGYFYGKDGRLKKNIPALPSARQTAEPIPRCRIWTVSGDM